MQIDENEQFREARDITRYFFDLELSLIELVHLRRYVRDAITRLSALTNALDPAYLNPAREAVARFFADYYELPPQDDKVLMQTLNGIPSKNLLAWLKKVQQIQHGL